MMYRWSFYFSGDMSWYVPLGENRPWKKPLKERHAQALRNEIWQPGTIKHWHPGTVKHWQPCTVKHWQPCTVKH